ncbi:hypothetical protein BMF94_3051 [Rhodotorula taiwanensis]|uniref:Major facilitator superfamily (MFS) profile domain-containing protein n=1 Tax=Rhodotorula taiwanensis TaxID=741276 RepID=A0A2S5BAX6_9BASI|nr:hypothetical protein BMF94_3051 [Rhodotorula taiwanensis]
MGTAAPDASPMAIPTGPSPSGDAPSIRSSSPTASSYPPAPSTKAPSERELAFIPPPDRGKAAYLFLAGAFTIETVIWGLPASYGLFLDYYQREGVADILGPPVALLLNPRPRWRLTVIRIGCCLCPISLLLSSFAKTGLLYSIGGSMAYYPTFDYLQEWFHERRGFANGVCFAGDAGTAAGGLILPFVEEALLSRFGAERTLQSLAVAFAILFAAALPLIRPRLPLPPKSSLPIKKAARESEREGETERRRSAANDTEPLTARVVVKNIRLWTFLAANILQGFGYFVTFLYLPTYATSLGLSGAQSSGVLACVNGACVVSRVTMGVLSDKKSPHQLGFAAMASSAVAISVLWGVTSTTFAPLVVFAIVMGLCSGGWTSLYSAIIKGFIADEPSLRSQLFSIISLTRGLGALLCAPIASALISHPLTGASKHTAYGSGDGKYGGIVLFAGLAMALGAALEGLEWLLPSRS